MYKLILFIFAFFIILRSCVIPRDTEVIIVASEQGDCIGVGPMKCLLIKHEYEEQWEYLYNSIEGFIYESGYEYEIEVRRKNVENPAADYSSIKYVFVKEISKTAKISVDLPPPPENISLTVDTILAH